MEVQEEGNVLDTRVVEVRMLVQVWRAECTQTLPLFYRKGDSTEANYVRPSLRYSLTIRPKSPSPNDDS
jgi:hypothetical protein